MLHMSIQVKRKHSGLPCAMALRLIRALPGDPAFLSPSSAKGFWPYRRLDANPGASGPHAFAVRRLAHRHAHPTSTAACPDVSDDGRRPLFSGQGKPDMPQTRIAEKQNISFRG